jgi:hypothetical protein
VQRLQTSTEGKNIGLRNKLSLQIGPSPSEVAQDADQSVVALQEQVAARDKSMADLESS